MRVTVVNSNKPKDSSIFYSIVLFILGIVLIFNSEGLISLIFEILGAVVLIFGFYQFGRYFQLKKQFQVDDGNRLMQSILPISIGLLIILLSSFLSATIQVVTGIWLFFLGISKISTAYFFKSSDKKQFIIYFTSAIILIIIGLYTIFSDNVVFIFLGIVLLCYSTIDILNFFLKKK